MLDKKAKYLLKTKANSLKPIVIIGKDGLSDNTIKSINDVLRTRELVKISILKTYVEMEKKDLAAAIATATHAELINIIGRTITIYKKNPEINAYGI